MSGEHKVLDPCAPEHAVHMRAALAQAREAGDRGDRSIGCVIVPGGDVIAQGGNRVYSSRSELDHAEVVALRCAAPYLFERAEQCVLYTTLEPCVMCLGSIVLAGIPHVLFGEYDQQHGASEMFRRVSYVGRTITTYRGGVLEDECADLRHNHV